MTWHVVYLAVAFVLAGLSFAVGWHRATTRAIRKVEAMVECGEIEWTGAWPK